MATKLDLRQSVLRSALSMVGSLANDTADTILSKIDAELAKLYEDRNLTLADGGLISFSAAGTSVTFTQSLKLHVNSKVAGGAPVVIDLGATTRALSVNLRMIYAVIDRVGGTATVTADSATLPAQTSANQEVVLIAKRIDSSDGTFRVYFRGGFSLSAGQSSRLGTAGTIFANEFAIADATDTTKKIVFQASGSSTASTLTLVSFITTNRVITFPDATTTVVGTDVTQILTNKQLSFSVSSDAATTGSNATLAAFTTGVVRVTNASLASISGIPAGNSGQFFVLENKTGVTINVNNEQAGATAANRITTGTGASVPMANNQTFFFVYDSTDSRWMFCGSAGTSSTTSFESSSYINGSITASVAANALTVSQKIQNGADATPSDMVQVAFRNSTANNGTFDIVNITAALSLVVDSGSTLGNSDGVLESIYVYLLNNAGTAELAVSSTLFDEGSLHSTTAIGGAGTADSRTTLYSTTARANVPIRLVGRLQSTQTVAGTWASAMSEISNIPFNLNVPPVINFLVDGTYTVPEGVFQLQLFTSGAGGGGGGGQGSQLSTLKGAGGAGGAGAVPFNIPIQVIPGDVLTITIGLGGTAGTAGLATGTNNGGNGGDGGDTTIVGTGINLIFPGAQGGLGATATNNHTATAARAAITSNDNGPAYLIQTGSGTGGGFGGQGGSASNGDNGGNANRTIYSTAGVPGKGGPLSNNGTNAVGGGGGGGAGAAGYGKGGTGGHGGGARATTIQLYATTAAVRTSNITTLTMANTNQYATHNFNVGDAITVAGLSAGFNGTFTILTVPTTLSITYSNPGIDETAADGVGTVDPLTAGQDGTLGSGGGGGGGVGQHNAGNHVGAAGGTGGAGFVIISY